MFIRNIMNILCQVIIDTYDIYLGDDVVQLINKFAQQTFHCVIVLSSHNDSNVKIYNDEIELYEYILAYIITKFCHFGMNNNYNDNKMDNSEIEIFTKITNKYKQLIDNGNKRTVWKYLLYHHYHCHCYSSTDSDNDSSNDSDNNSDNNNDNDSSNDSDNDSSNDSDNNSVNDSDNNSDHDRINDRIKNKHYYQKDYINISLLGFKIKKCILNMFNMENILLYMSEFDQHFAYYDGKIIWLNTVYINKYGKSSIYKSYI